MRYTESRRIEREGKRLTEINREWEDREREEEADRYKQRGGRPREREEEAE